MNDPVSGMVRLHGKIKNGRLVITERPHKYGAIKVEVDGHKFDSMLEARRYRELKLLEKAGEIRDLVLQPFWDVDIGGLHVCRYRADFAYFDGAGRLRVEDTKGANTPIFAIKRKLVEGCHGIKIEVIRG